jgi:hypothetical protein
LRLSRRKILDLWLGFREITMRVPFWKKREKDEILSRNEKRRGSVCIV